MKIFIFYHKPVRNLFKSGAILYLELRKMSNLILFRFELFRNFSSFTLSLLEFFNLKSSVILKIKFLVIYFFKLT